MLPSRSHQQPKPSAAGDEKVDEPASEYARLERLVVAWLVGDSILFTFAALSKIESRGRTYTTHLEMMTWPICMSLCCLYFFGTLDSSAVGKRAVVIWGLFWLHQAIFLPIHHWSKGGSKIYELVGAFVWNAFIGAALGWLMNLIRSEFKKGEGPRRISASRGVPSALRHRGDSSPGMMAVGGFFVGFEAVRTASGAVPARTGESSRRAVLDAVR